MWDAFVQWFKQALAGVWITWLKIVVGVIVVVVLAAFLPVPWTTILAAVLIAAAWALVGWLFQGQPRLRKMANVTLGAVLVWMGFMGPFFDAYPNAKETIANTFGQGTANLVISIFYKDVDRDNLAHQVEERVDLAVDVAAQQANQKLVAAFQKRVDGHVSGSTDSPEFRGAGDEIRNLAVGMTTARREGEVVKRVAEGPRKGILNRAQPTSWGGWIGSGAIATILFIVFMIAAWMVPAKVLPKRVAIATASVVGAFVAFYLLTRADWFSDASAASLDVTVVSVTATADVGGSSSAAASAEPTNGAPKTAAQALQGFIACKKEFARANNLPYQDVSLRADVCVTEYDTWQDFLDRESGRRRNAPPASTTTVPAPPGTATPAP